MTIGVEVIHCHHRRLGRKRHGRRVQRACEEAQAQEAGEEELSHLPHIGKPAPRGKPGGESGRVSVTRLGGAMAGTEWIDRGDGVRLALAHTPGEGPLVVFLPGYMSDMAGTKALHLEGWAERRGRAFLRFDYSGCGRSHGRFEAGSIRRWAADARAVIEARAPADPLILVGSSMGGWIMLHLALSLGERVRALVGIAAAPDFTSWGLALSEEDRARLRDEGEISRPSRYGPDPYRYTRALIEDGGAALLLERPIPFHGPVRLLHGEADPDVPWAISLRLMAALGSGDVRLTLVKGGDHRLSAPGDLALLEATLEELC